MSPSWILNIKKKKKKESVLKEGVLREINKLK